MVVMSRGVRVGAVAAALVGLLALAACTSSGVSAGGGTADGTDGTLAVVTSFYPLAYLAQRIGGDRVSVTNLASGGVEPHDLELTPKDVADIDQADLVVYLHGFQPAVDDAVAAASR